MTAPFKGSIQPEIHNFQCQLLSHDSLTQSHHIGIVMESGHTGGNRIGKKGTADTGNLIGYDGNTDACGANYDASFAFPGGYGSGRRLCIIGIITAVEAVRTEILDRKATVL